MATQADVDTLASLIEAPAQSDSPVTVAPTLVPPPTEVELPLGLWSPVAAIRDTAEVRELNGYDEEVLARHTTIASSMQVMLERAVVKIGGVKATPQDLEELSAGDRMELLLAIRRVTWGDEVETYTTCPECRTEGAIDVPLESIPRRIVQDKVAGRQFEVTLSRGPAVFQHLPGDVHRKLLQEKYANSAEVVTATIVGCAVDIPGMLVVTPETVKAMSMKDRRAALDGIGDHPIGPDTDHVPVVCEACGEEYTLALQAGALFPL